MYQDEKIQSRVRSCSKCSAAIVWLPNKDFKKVPVNSSTVQDSDEVYDPQKHTMHYRTCEGNTMTIKIAVKLVEAIDQSWKNDPESRGYLGASSLGKACARELWYGFRWVLDKNFPSRILRLFHRGHREEETFELILKKAGIPYFPNDPATGEQFLVTFRNKHIKGHSDGRGTGLSDLPEGVQFLGEFKTHSNKSFNHLVKYGVYKSKPVHYTQMQLYMHELKLPWALYGAVNKNSDELHWELIEYDEKHSVQCLTRADRIVAARTPPGRISSNPNSLNCKFCDFSTVCHKGHRVKVNCRTCRHIHPLVDGRWWCGQYDKIMTTAHQRAGCSNHVQYKEDQ